MPSPTASTPSRGRRGRRLRDVVEVVVGLLLVVGVGAVVICGGGMLDHGGAGQDGGGEASQEAPPSLDATSEESVQEESMWEESEQQQRESSAAPGLGTEGDVRVTSAFGSQDNVLSYEVDEGLVAFATRLLSSYEERGDCVLASSGFLDLLGRTWSCTVEGDGWVDVCMVDESDDGTSSVCVIHLDEEGVGREMVEAMAEER